MFYDSIGVIVNYKEFEQFFTSIGRFSIKKFKKDSTSLNFLMEKTSFLDENVSINERMYVYLNDINEPVKCECGKPVKFTERLKKGYREYCSLKCSQNSQKTKDKKKHTCYINYGVDNPSKSKVIKDKKVETCNKNYGVDNPAQSKIVIEKMSKTNIMNYGVYNIKYYDNPKAFKLLSDKEWLEKEYENKPASKIAEELCIGHAVVCRYILNHGLKSNRWSNSVSYQETEVLNFVKSIYDGEIISNSKNIIKPLEIDIYLPEKKLAIEFNGMHWHSTKYKDKFYHLNKTLECESQGIQLLQIFENEWIEKQDIWKSVIRTKLGLIDTKIYGRKCVIKKVSNSEGKLFFDNNHLQGGLSKGKHLGLYFEDKIVACISYGSSRFENNTTEIYRFASMLNISVVGGFSKLLNKVPKPIVSYANRRWSKGDVYIKNKFEFISETEPNYIYYKGGKIYSRQKFMKHKLSGLVGTGMLEFYFEEFTETENMEINGFEKIYDCGNLKYVLQ